MPSSLTPHVWNPLALIEEKEPPGGLDWPSKSFPQHSTVPSGLTPHVWNSPALTDMKVFPVDRPVSTSDLAVLNAADSGVSVSVEADSEIGKEVGGNSGVDTASVTVGIRASVDVGSELGVAVELSEGVRLSEHPANATVNSIGKAISRHMISLDTCTLPRP